MRYVKTTVDTYRRSVNLNAGDMPDFFTEEEVRAFRAGKVEMVHGTYSLKREVTHANHTTHLSIDRTYLEGKLGLRPLLAILKKLSNTEKGALSKQLYKYYGKVGVSAMRGDFNKLYQKRWEADISDLEDRKFHTSDVLIHYGNKEFYGWQEPEEALTKLTEAHLGRCLAILIERGYITTANETRNRAMRGRRYTYSDTHYKLTDKAEALLIKKVGA